MVPQTLWGKNLRAVLPQEQWDVVRRYAYAAAGNRCRVCGERGPQWPVEADEAWEYDDETRTQTLKGVVALCPDCHHIRHWGKTQVDGREEEAFARLMAINRWSRATAEKVVDDAMDQWRRRSSQQWVSDFSWVTRVHGFEPDDEGERRAAAANRELVAKASERAGSDNLAWLHEVERPQVVSGSAPLSKPVPASRLARLWARMRSMLGGSP